jgi:hypothetical protein
MSLSNDVPVAGSTSSNRTTDDDFKFLSEGDPLDSLNVDKPLSKDKEEKPAKEVKSSESEIDLEDEVEEGEAEEDPLAEIEEELQEVDPEKLEVVTPAKRKDILKAYPDLFKKFPYLEKAYYREQQFTEIHGTIEEAKQAKADQQTLHAYAKDVIEDGNVTNVLKLIRDGNPEKFNEVADSYLDHLYEVDKIAYHHVTGNVVKQIVMSLYQAGKESGDEELLRAALAVNKQVFGTSKYTPPQRLAADKPAAESEKETQISQREREFVERQIKTTANEISTRVNNSIKSYIETNIDPKGSMSDYVKTKAMGDAMEKITELMGKDARFSSIMDKLWEKSAKDNFSEESKTAIRRALLAKAKSLLEPVVKSSRNTALKGMGRKSTADEPDDEVQPERQRMKRTNESRSDSKPKSQTTRSNKSSYELLNELMGD